MAKLLLSPQARIDLQGIRTYIERESGEAGIALKQVADIMQKLRMLQEQPQMGVSLAAMIGLPTDYRYLVCGSYYAFYRHADGAVFIVRILHCSRDFMRVLFGVSQD